MAVPNGASVVRFIRGAAGEADNLPDAELVRRFAADADADEQAFRSLVARHGPVVWAVCRRMLRNHHDAEDAFQATFMVLARGIGGIRRGEAVGGWLCGVAGRVAARARAKSKPESAAAEPAVGHPDGALGDLTVREAEAVLYEELAGLPERYRTVLVLCCLEGLSRDEALARLGWTANQLRNCLEQGRERLRSRLARRGIALGLPLLVALLAPPPTVAAELAEAAVQHAIGGLPPAAINTLASEVSRTMWVVKWKWAVAGCAALVLTAGGILAAGFGESPQAVPQSAPLAKAAVPVPQPKPAAPEPEKPLPTEPVEIAAAFLQSIIDGKPERALKLADPRAVDERHTKEIQVSGLKRVKFALVLMNNARVQVVTERAQLVRRPGAEAEDGHVAVILEREKTDGPWIVRDSDVVDDKRVLREIDHYLAGDYNFKKPTPPATKDAPPPPPRTGKDMTPDDVATEFLALAFAEKDADALKLCVPGTVSEKKVGEIRKAGFTSAKPVAVLVNDTRAEVVFDGPQEEKGEKRHLVLMQTKATDGSWQVKDIDARSDDEIESRVEHYLAGKYNTAVKP